ncbi:MAG: acyl CoA:acetate/3-ketoacid CoA transferase [Thermoproteota archaeon]
MVMFTSAEKAVSYIKDGDTIGLTGFTGANFPEEVILALRDRFLTTGNPRNLTIVTAAGTGDGSGNRGIDLIAYEGLIKRLIFSHCGLLPRISRLIVENKILAYNFPQGVISQLFREIAGRRPGLITKIGLYTYVDPRIEGGKVNDLTKDSEDLVQIILLNGEEYLLYKSFPINVGIIRGTTADEAGNISMEREGFTLENLSIAQAAKNSGGIVIAQVERVAKRGSLPSRMVKIPGIFVDYVVVAKPEHHWQSAVEPYNPAISGEIKIPLERIRAESLNERKIIGRRALMELRPNYVVNLGIGIPESVSEVAAEEGVSDLFTLTVESGIVGGVPLGGKYFGLGVNFDAIIDQQYMFDFYDGGGLDIAFLGFAQVDEKGNVNVSKFGGRYVGCGGFINISQSTRKVVFCGTFTAGGLVTEVKNGKLKIIKEGAFKKFVKSVEHITFSGEYASKQNKEVMFITERAVFKLGKRTLILKEIAPGIDIDRDILENMDFKVEIPDEVKFMDERIFREEKMNIRDDWLQKSPLSP